MKRFILCFVLGIGFGTYVLAQTNGYSGFNFVIEEEGDAKPDEQVIQQPNEQNVQPEAEENKNSENDVTPKAEKKVPPKVEKTVAKRRQKASATEQPAPQEVVEEDEEETEEDKERRIYLALTDVNSTLAAVRSVSYCSGVVVVFNDTKKEIQELSGTIGIGNQKKDFKFTKVTPGASIGWPIQIIGEACASIFALPDLQINKCQVQGMSDKRCRSKLIFVPLKAR